MLSESSHHLVRSELREVKARMETRRQECSVAEKTQEQWQRTKDKSSSRRATNRAWSPVHRTLRPESLQ